MIKPVRSYGARIRALAVGIVLATASMLSPFSSEAMALAHEERSPARQWASERDLSLESIGPGAVAAGETHTCALTPLNTVKCWGNNGNGQLGNGTRVSSVVPVDVGGSDHVLSDVKAVAAGYLHTCAVLNDGGARCWGLDSNGQLGNGGDGGGSTPVMVSGLTGAIAITTGQEHSCALLADGTARCWGLNYDGQLGNGSTVSSNAPVVVRGLGGAIDISAGHAHACALLSNGRARCWGANQAGQLGNGTNVSSTIPVDVNNLSNIVAIRSGGAHTCAVLNDGGVQCWGSNDGGQLGNGNNNASYVPIPVRSIEGAKALTGGSGFTCAVLDNGSARCWGRNAYGQLGNGGSEDSNVPVVVSGLNNISSIAANAYHACAMTVDSRVHCWGQNVYGQLGNDHLPSWVVLAPGDIGLQGVTKIASGSGHSCVVLAGGAVHCWGDNMYGGLGNGSNRNFSELPVPVSGIGNATVVGVGANHTCAALTDGSVRCWGDGLAGQLGDGRGGGESAVPVTVDGLAGAVAVAAGYAHSCAILVDGTARCWGANYYGQLGNGSGSSSARPVAVSGLLDAKAITAGGGHTCALLRGGEVHCWGANGDGQLGNGSNGDSLLPVVASGVTEAVAIAAGQSHTCALINDGTVRCWGRIALSNGDTSNVPVQVAGLSGAIAIAAGLTHTCAALEDGSQRCWGSNDSGQLGDGNISGESSVPVVVNGLAGVVAVAAGRSLTCALLGNGTVRCWGDNTVGQVGNGEGPWSRVPVAVIGTPFADWIFGSGFD